MAFVIKNVLIFLCSKDTLKMKLAFLLHSYPLYCLFSFLLVIGSRTGRFLSLSLKIVSITYNVNSRADIFSILNIKYLIFFASPAIYLDWSKDLKNKLIKISWKFYIASNKLILVILNVANAVFDSFSTHYNPLSSLSASMVEAGKWNPKIPVSFGGTRVTKWKKK